MKNVVKKAIACALVMGTVVTGGIVFNTPTEAASKKEYRNYNFPICSHYNIDIASNRVAGKYYNTSVDIYPSSVKQSNYHYHTESIKHTYKTSKAAEKKTVYYYIDNISKSKITDITGVTIKKGKTISNNYTTKTKVTGKKEKKVNTSNKKFYSCKDCKLKVSENEVVLSTPCGCRKNLKIYIYKVKVTY